MKLRVLIFFLPLVFACRGLAELPDVLATSDLRGRLTGEAGLARRAARLKNLRESQPALIVDAGNLFHGAAESAKAPEIISAAYGAMAYDAINLSLADVRGDLTALRESIDRHQLPVVSANLQDADTGELLFPSGITATLGDETFRIVGLTAPPPASLGSPDGIRVGDPGQALARELEKTEHRVIVLFHGAALSAHLAVRSHADRLDAVVINGEGTATRIAGVPVLFGGENGRGIARLRLSDPDPQPEFFRLRQEDPADPAVNRLISERLATARAERREREVSLRPGPPSSLPDPGEPVRLLAQTFNQGLGLTVYDWRLESEFGSLQAPEGHQLLVIRASVGNRMHPRLARDLDYAEAVQVTTLQNKLFLAVNQRRLIRHDSRALNAPDHLPNQFRILQPGRTAEGTIVFFLPAGDIHQLDLLLYHDEFPALNISLMESEKPGEAPDPRVSDENEVAVLEVHGVERSPSPREGYVRLNIDLRGRSLMTRQADSAALDPAVPTGENRKVPHAIPAEYHYFPDLIALSVTGERFIPFNREASEFPSTPVLPPDRSLGGRLVFDVPETYADHRMVLHAWFPTLSISGGQRGAAVSPEPITLSIQDGNTLDLPDPVHTMQDGDLALHLLDMTRQESFYGLPAPTDKVWISALLRLENRGDSSGLMPMKERLGLRGDGERIPFDPEASRQGPFHPTDSFYLPAGEGRVFEVVFAVPEDRSDWIFDYRGANTNHHARVRPTEGIESGADAPVVSEAEESASEGGESDFAAAGSSKNLLNPDLKFSSQGFPPLNLATVAWEAPEKQDPDEGVVSPPGEGFPIGRSLEGDGFSLTAHRLFVLHAYYGKDLDEGTHLLAVEVELKRMPNREGAVVVADLEDALFLRTNGRRLRAMKRFDRTDPQLANKIQLDEQTQSVRNFVFYQIPKGQVASADLVLAERGRRPSHFQLLPVDGTGPEEPEPIMEATNRAVTMGLYGSEIQDKFQGSSTSKGLWLVVDLRGRSRLRAEKDPESGGDGDPLRFTWREYRPRMQLILDGVRTVFLNWNDVDFFPEAELLPELWSGGHFAFELSREKIEAAQTIQLQLGFMPVVIPGERVMVPEPLYFTLKGDPDTLPASPEPMQSLVDLNLTVDLIRALRPDTVGGWGEAGEGASWVQVDVGITATAEQGVWYEPDFLGLITPGRTVLRPHRETWYGPDAIPNRIHPTWIPKGGRREFSMFWQVKEENRPVRLQVNGVKHYGTVDLFPDENLDVEGLVNAEADRFISEQGIRVLNPGSEPAGIAGVGLKPEQVNQAIDRGRDYLWAEVQKELMDRRRLNNEFFPAMLALVHCDAHLMYPDFDRKLRDFIQKSRVVDNSVYENALLAMIIESYGDPSFLPKMKQVAHWLVETQGEAGTWSYNAPVPSRFFPEPKSEVAAEKGALLRIAGGQPRVKKEDAEETIYRTQSWEIGKNGDHSCTQFAVLGLWSAERSGIRIDDDVWERVLTRMSRHQTLSNGDKFGGYGYHTQGGAYGSMTGAGICVLAIAMDRLFDDLTPRHHLRIRNALGWMVRNFSVSVNPVTEKYNFYYLYSIERVGQILGIDFMGDHEWYPLGAKYLVTAQKGDGSWPTGPSEDTSVLTSSYALLFLTRATPELDAEPEPEPTGPGTLTTVVERPDTRHQVYLILDASGSMRPAINGKAKLDIARQAVGELLDVLPEQTRVAVRVYGHRKRSVEPGAEEDTELVVPWMDLDPEAIRKKLETLQPMGKTPMALSLKEAAGEIRGGGDGKTLLVLLTDGGEDNRNTDPVAAASSFADREDVEFFILGFDINRPDWTRQLTEMATVANGIYHPVNEASALARDLRAVVYPPVPEFTIIDAEGNIVKTAIFGSDSITLLPGDYMLKTAGDETETPFRIRAEGTTRITLDMAHLATREPATPSSTREADTPSPSFCTQCGASLKADARFCINCGSPVN